MKRLFVLLCCLILAASVAAATLASASGKSERSEKAEGRVTSQGRYAHYEVSQAARQAAIDYWTPARMQAAVPKDLYRPGGADVLGASPSRVKSFDQGSAGFIPAVTPASVSSQQSSSSTRIVSNAATVGYTYPFPYSRYEAPGLTNYTAYPYKVVGKIFATDASGDYVCSGAAVVSANESVVWTAGHCAFLKNTGWFTNLIFVPGYRDGSAPFGQWIATDGWTLNAWRKSNDVRSDVAALVVGPTSGVTLTDAVGSLGFAWSVGRIKHWEALGYPAAPPFNGNRQHICSASFAANDSRFRRRPTMAIGCDMTPGSSGGPWILGFGHDYYINGVNSYSYARLRQAMFSPYFGNAMNGLLKCAEDGVC